jgi:hypothetical protein
MVMGMGMRISINMSLFSITLVGKGAIRKITDKNIQERDRDVLLNFHIEFDMGGNVINMVEESDQGRMAMRPNEKCVIDKAKPILRFELKVV